MAAEKVVPRAAAVEIPVAGIPAAAVKVAEIPAAAEIQVAAAKAGERQGMMILTRILATPVVSLPNYCGFQFTSLCMQRQKPLRDPSPPVLGGRGRMRGGIIARDDT